MNNPRIHLKGWIKLFLFFLVLIGSILVLYIRIRLTSKSKQQKVKFSARQQFCKRANQIFGVELKIIGVIPPPGCYLYISNHRSFYDPVAFLSQLIANPVSKAEVSNYPIIGWGTKLTEVLMLDRSEKKERSRMKHQIYECLDQGTSILVYPEGTTSSAVYTGVFKKGAFESAVEAKRAVVPVAIEYPDKSFYWTDRSLYDQFLYQIASRHDNRIYLCIGEPITESDPMKLMAKTKRSIEDMITVIRNQKDQISK